MALGNPTAPFPAVQVTTQSITSAPFTPVAGALVIVQTTSTGSAAATGSGSIDCTIPGMGAASWKNVQWNPSTAAKEGGSFYWCLAPANPVQGTVTVTLSAIPNEVRMASIQIPGADAATPVVGAVSTGLDSTGTINLTLGATPTAADCVVVGAGSRNGWHTAPFPASAGFTKIAESYGSANPESSLMLEYAMGYTSSSVTVSGMYTADNEAMGLIVKPAASGPPNTTKTVGYTGSGSLAAVLAPAVALTALFTGAGALGAPVVPRAAVAAPFAGSGTATVATVPGKAVTAPFAGAGALSAVAVPHRNLAVAFDGSGTLTATAQTVGSVTATFTGAGALGAALVPSLAAAFTGTGQASASITPKTTANAALNGSGALAAAAIPAVAYQAELDGDGTLTVQLAPSATVDAAFTGSGVLRADVPRTEAAVDVTLDIIASRTRPAVTVAATRDRSAVSPGKPRDRAAATVAATQQAWTISPTRTKRGKNG